jgi:hypothetical protein
MQVIAQLRRPVAWPSLREPVYKGPGLRRTDPSGFKVYPTSPPPTGRGQGDFDPDQGVGPGSITR